MKMPLSSPLIRRALLLAGAALLLVLMLWARDRRDDARLSPARIKREAVAAERNRTPSLAPASREAQPPAPEPLAREGTGTPASPDAAEGEAATLPAPRPARSVDETCAADWQEIVSSSAEAFAHRVEQGLLALSAACQEAMATAADLGEFSAFLSRCTSPAAPPPEAHDFCVSQSEAFRTALVSRSGGGSSDPSAADYTSIGLASLVDRIGSGLKNAEQLSEPTLDALIAMSDEATSRDPDFYEAYKARLAGLLLKEVRFGAEIPAETYSDIIDELNTFRLAEDTPAAEEMSTARASAKQQLAELDDELSAIATQRDAIRAEIDQLTTGAASSQDELVAILAEDRLLEADQQALWQDYRSAQEDLRRMLLTEREAVDSDLVRLPFVRLLAKGELEDLQEESSAYIAEYPTSPLGYFFKAQAEWRAGDRDEAAATITQAIASGAGDEGLRELVEREAGRSSDEYVYQLGRSTGQLMTAVAGQLAGE
jgi:hypothetical protein